MAKLAKKKSSLKPKKVVDPQVKAKRRQVASVRSLFRRLDFTRIPSNGTQITFKGRTGELDDIFIHKNIMIVTEYTVGQATNAHVAKKSLLYNLIDGHQEEWIKFAEKTYAEFATIFTAGGFLAGDYRVCICYFSTQGVSDEISDNVPSVCFLDGTNFRYFDALAKAIHMSARYELFKFFLISPNPQPQVA